MATAVSLVLAGSLVLPGLGVAAEADPEAIEVELAPVNSPTSVRIAEALGSDPEAIFRYVADGIRYEPYSGVLRGAAGTWYSRAGNSADQALLLARLLEGAGVDSRYATGAIDEATQQALLDAAVASPDDIRALADEASAGLVPGEAPADLPPIDPEAQAMVDNAAATSEAADAWAAEQLSDSLDVITGALGDAGVELDASFTAVPPLEADQHIWVQAEIDGVWTDLDPTLPGAAFGESLTEPAEILDEMPSELEHTISLAVIAETLTDGALTEAVLARVSLPAYEAAGQPITITNLGTDAVPTLARGFQQIMGQRSYSPIIVVGRRQFGGLPMIFSEPGGGGFFSAPSDAPETTAEWIELTLSAPGAEPVVVRRSMFDRIGPFARAAGNVSADSLEPIETVDLGDGRAEELAPLQSAVWITVATGLPRRDAPITRQEPGATGAGAMTPYSQQMITELAGLDYAVPMGVRPFIDAPNVTALTWNLSSTETSPVQDLATDIWYRSHGTAPVAGIEPSVPPSIVPGILAHLAERLASGAGRPDAAPDISVGAVFDAAALSGIGLRTASTLDSVADLQIDQDALQRLQDSIAAGHIAVVPEALVDVAGEPRTGWWLIDPASGLVADQLDNGRGQVIAEYSTSLDEAISYYKDLKCVFDVVLPLWKQAISTVGALGTGMAVEWVSPEYDSFTDCDPT
ncbi:MAG: hypothetical protein ACC726_04790 [Chloroflexota bacterium]